MTTYSTGYSPIPKTYDEYVNQKENEIIFGRRHSDLDLSAPQGTVDTKAFSSADKLWSGTNGTTRPAPDPKLNNTQQDNNSFKFPTVEDTDDWRHQALPRTTIPAGVKDSIAYRFDSGKTDWSLMPWEAVEEINKVLEFGAKKYSSQNWRVGSGFSWTRVLSSLFRHTFAWARGEDLDPESGLSHLSHMGCNVIFLIYYNRYKDRYNNDDRVKP